LKGKIIYCSRCGVENADRADVCSGCGFILAGSSPAPPAGAVEGKTCGLAITSFAIAGISVSAVYMLVILPMVMAIMLPALSRTKTMAQRIVCATTLKGLGTAMYVYASDYDDKLPTADKWCDLLTLHMDVNPASLRCASTPMGSFSYALNENLVGRSMKDVSPNVVMLFEADAGPNAVGGPEMLVSDRHEGCNIVFTDGHVEFIKESGIGNLKWTVERED